MILTVTPNTAVDRVLFFRGFDWGHTTRADDAVWSPGGKGTDVAWILGEMGYPCLATGLAAGETGRRLQAMIESRGSRVEFVWADGETRTNYVLVDTARNTQATITVSGLAVRPDHVAALEATIARELPSSRALVLGGTLPAGMAPDWYIPWIERARGLGLPVLLDVSGPPLAACARAGATVLKPNLDELVELVSRALATQQEIVAAAREILVAGSELVLASLGSEGALAVTAQQAWYLPPLPVEPVNCAGAGDALTAGLAQGYAEGWPLERSLRLAVAAATAVVITKGTAECHKEDVDRFLPQVRMVPVS